MTSEKHNKGGERKGRTLRSWGQNWIDLKSKAWSRNQQKPGVPVPDQNLSHPATPIPHPPEAWSLVTDPLPSGITVNQGITGQAWHIATQHLLFKCEWLFWIPKIHEFLFLVEISSTWLLFKINHKILCMSLQRMTLEAFHVFVAQRSKKSSTHALKNRKTYW